MSQPITEIPMAKMTPPAAYPSIENMSTQAVSDVSGQTTEQCEHHRNEESGSSLLRLRGGAGCLTNCLATIGCCCICEECCC